MIFPLNLSQSPSYGFLPLHYLNFPIFSKTSSRHGEAARGLHFLSPLSVCTLRSNMQMTAVNVAYICVGGFVVAVCNFNLLSSYTNNKYVLRPILVLDVLPAGKGKGRLLYVLWLRMLSYSTPDTCE